MWKRGTYLGGLQFHSSIPFLNSFPNSLKKLGDKEKNKGGERRENRKEGGERGKCLYLLLQEFKSLYFAVVWFVLWVFVECGACVCVMLAFVLACLVLCCVVWCIVCGMFMCGCVVVRVVYCEREGEGGHTIVPLCKKYSTLGTKF